MQQLPPGFVLDGQPAPQRAPVGGPRGIPGSGPKQPTPYQVEEDRRRNERADRADARADRADARAAEAAARAEVKANQQAGGNAKPLRQGDGTKLTALVDQYAGLRDAALGFEDDFAGNWLGGELENWTQGKFGVGTEGQRDWWSAFRATDNLIRNDLFGASLTDGEKRAYEQTTSDPSMDPKIVKENLERRVAILQKGLERNFDRFRAAGFNEDELEALAGEYAPNFGMGKPVKEAAEPFVLPKAAGVKEAAPMEVDGATSKGGLQEIPELRGIDNTVVDMIGKNASTGQIVDFLDGELGKYGAQVGTNLMGYIGDIVRKHKANPSQPVRSLGSGWEMLYHKQLPESEEGNSFLGIDPDSTAGNAIMNTANSVTAGLPAYLADKQGVLEEANAERPGAALTGKIAGSLGAMGGISAGAKALGGPVAAALTRGGGVGGDMLYGSVQGGLEDGPMGAVTGAAAAGLGNKVGSAAVSGVGRAIRGVSDEAVKRLSAAGVPMTAGMIMGRNNSIGNIMNLLESAPGIRGMMGRRYQDAEEGVYRAALNESVEGVGGKIADIGSEGLDQAYNTVDTAYRDALDGRQFNANEPEFLDAMAAAIEKGQKIPEIGEQFAHAIRNDIKPLFNEDGVLTGDRLQDALQLLRKRRASYSGQPLGDDIGGAFLDVEKALKQMVGRQAPDVVPKLTAANRAYMKVNTLADAAKTAVNKRGNPSPAQINRASVSATTKYGGKRAAVTGDRPFKQLGDDAQEVIPSRVNDSGTASRAAALALPALLGGGAYGSGEVGAGPGVYVPLGVLAALTSKTGARGLQKLLTGDRSATALKVGNRLVDQRRKAALLGAAVAPNLVE